MPNRLHQGQNYQDFLKWGGCFWVILLVYPAAKFDKKCWHSGMTNII